MSELLLVPPHRSIPSSQPHRPQVSCTEGTERHPLTGKASELWGPRLSALSLKHDSEGRRTRVLPVGGVYKVFIFHFLKNNI